MTFTSYRTPGCAQARKIAAHAAAKHDARRWAVASRLLRRALLAQQLRQEAMA
ncbi:hypothetical protein ACVOZ6_004696 [Escherichia coli]